MVYIRPPSRIKPAPAIKPVVSHDNERELDFALGRPIDAPHETYVSAPVAERRNRRDRRNKSQEALLETRASKNRRKSNAPSISVTV